MKRGRYFEHCMKEKSQREECDLIFSGQRGPGNKLERLPLISALNKTEIAEGLLLLAQPVWFWSHGLSQGSLMLFHDASRSFWK